MSKELEAARKAAILRGSGLVSANKFFSDCYISGDFNGIKFYQSDIRNIRADRNGQTLEYDGTFIAFPTSLPDATQTNIYHRDVDCSIILPGKEYKTGRSDFASAFKVATNQPQKAQMLLNDTFMSNLLYLQSLTERKIALTVKNGWIYILMPNKKSVLR